MAGHSKWANIQHRKKAQDAKRGKLFTKLIREITVAARMGGEDLDSNSRLRLAVDKALGGNMSRDTIDRAIKRGAGSLDGDNVEEITYEGYAAGGVAVLVECLTDNRNRTVSEVRHAFSKCGGNLGTDGSVAYLFSKQGLLTFAPGCNDEQIYDVAIDAGADDVKQNEDGSLDVITTVADFLNVKAAMAKAELVPDMAEVTMIPSIAAEVDEVTTEKVTRLIDMLEELDDVQAVYSNGDYP